MGYSEIILLAAKAAKVPPALLLAICVHESGLSNALVPQDGHSPTYGICQVKYETAQMIGYKGSASKLMVPSENAKWAALYLKYQLDRYEDSWVYAVAAYNAGSFNESKAFPGCPRNLKYVLSVRSKLPRSFDYRFACGPEEAETIARDP